MKNAVTGWHNAQFHLKWLSGRKSKTSGIRRMKCKHRITYDIFVSKQCDLTAAIPKKHHHWRYTLSTQNANPCIWNKCASAMHSWETSQQFQSTVVLFFFFLKKRNYMGLPRAAFLLCSTFKTNATLVWSIGCRAQGPAMCKRMSFPWLEIQRAL